MQQQQAEQPQRLGLVWHQPCQQASQPDRFGAQAGADQLGPGTGAIALVEQRVDDGKHGAKPVRQQMRGRYPVRDAGVGDLPLGPHQALGHRLFGNQERACDLGGGQPGESAQREGNLRLDGQRRVAAGEHQSQPVVADPAAIVFAPADAEIRHRHLPELGLTDGGAAQHVIGTVAGGGLQPPGGAGRDPVARPALEGFRERVLGAFLSQIPVAGDADQVRHHTPPLRAERLGDSRPGAVYISHTGRTSIVP